MEFKHQLDATFSKKDVLLSLSGRALDKFLIHDVDIGDQNVSQILDLLEGIMVGQTTMT